jgi:hypothetical protein
MTSPQEARELMKQLKPDHIALAISRIDAGEAGGFADSTKYDLLLKGKRYAPKRVIGLALNSLSGLTFDPYAFKGGEASLCFRTLQRLNFDIVDKDGKDFPRPKYEMLTRDWVVEAIKALSGRATPAQIQAWIVPRRPDFKVSNVVPDLQLLTVNAPARSNHFHNKKPRRCDTGDDFDLLFLETSGQYVFYDPKKHGVWELAHVQGDAKLRPRLVLGAAEASGLLAAQEQAEINKDFDAKSTQDAREKVLRQIALRQGQPKFRRDLIAAYEGKCAVTRCDVQDALEAAHIVPFKGPQTNSVRNGLLLRADIHTLFDLGLFRIDPATYTVILSPALMAGSYAGLAGIKLNLPRLAALFPDPEAFEVHGEHFRRREQIEQRDSDNNSLR